MIYGYARVSTPKQNIQRQLRNILQYAPDAKIFQEKYSGVTLARPEWKKLMKAIEPNDTIVFDEVSRMSRNAEEGFKEYERLFKMNVNLIFIRQPHVNSDVYRTALSNTIEMTGIKYADIFLNATNTFLLLLAENQIKLAFEQSELEIKQLHTRTKQGIETARKAGKQIGQKPGAKLVTKKSIPAKSIILKHSKHFGGNLNDSECAAVAKIARSTFYRYKEQLIAELDKQQTEQEQEEKAAIGSA